VDDLLENGDVCWDSVLFNGYRCVRLNFNRELLKLNQSDKYLNKIIAYAGNHYSQNLYNKVLPNRASGQLSSIIKNYSKGAHGQLDLSAVLMARMPIIPEGYQYGDIIDPSNCYFKANDGLVPLSSALFLPAGSSNNIFTFNNKGQLNYNDAVSKAENLCQIGECHIVDGDVDHLSFLDNGNVIQQIIIKIQSLEK